MARGDKFQIGQIYTLKTNDTTELIPRHAISYVSAKSESRPLFLVVGIVGVLIGALAMFDESARLALAAALDASEGFVTAVPLVVGLLLILAYLGSRRVGVIVASSGGRLFIETRGRNRLDVVESIRSDLSTIAEPAPAEPDARSKAKEGDIVPRR